MKSGDQRWEELKIFPADVEAGSPVHRAAHRLLLDLVTPKESDFAPWGKRDREGEHWQDCSCGCRHWAPLEGALGADWGVCMNRRSPRAGLLTFEHQGCPEFEAGPEDAQGEAHE